MWLEGPYRLALTSGCFCRCFLSYYQIGVDILDILVSAASQIFHTHISGRPCKAREAAVSPRSPPFTHTLSSQTPLQSSWLTAAWRAIESVPTTVISGAQLDSLRLISVCGKAYILPQLPAITRDTGVSEWPQIDTTCSPTQPHPSRVAAGYASLTRSLLKVGTSLADNTWLISDDSISITMVYGA